jgi:hypothetical protein
MTADADSVRKRAAAFLQLDWAIAAYESCRQIGLALNRSKTNVYNTPVSGVTPKQNDVIRFSSPPTHMVESNTSNRPRHAIAFNTFVNGKLGNYRDVPALAL